VKIGAENKNKVIALAVLGVVAVGMLAHALWPSPAAPAPTPVVASTPARPNIRRTTSGKVVKVVEPRLDPTLDLKLLSQSEQAKYHGNGRNIFVNGQSEIEAVRHQEKIDTAHQPPPPPPPPPPINLKFFGFANKPGEPKKIFLSQGEDIWVASEGDIVDRRYRVLHISPAAVDIEDVLNNNRQSIPLTQG
jgi:hypothetical protein